MADWIAALNACLPNFIRSVALTGIFDSLSIGTYTDYDNNEVWMYSGNCSTKNVKDIENLRNFAANIRTRGGGAEEASKTAIYKLIELGIKTDKLYILHLADMPPHPDFGGMCRDSLMEKQFLGDNYNFITLAKLFTDTYPNSRYCCLTSTTRENLYCYLAQKNGGDVCKINRITQESISKHINHILNGWMNIDDTPVTISQIPNKDYQSERDTYTAYAVQKQAPVTPDQLLSSSVLNTIKKIRSDEPFIEYTIAEFSSIINTDPMLLTNSPLIGKLWRELCKRRHDRRRDELIEQLSKVKHSLSTANKAILDAWLTESYNCIDEINDYIQTFMTKNTTNGLIRFLPEDDTMKAQQIVHLLAMNNKKTVSIIRHILSRMYIDEKYTHEPIVPNTDLDLPPGSIPLNMNIAAIMELLMHTVAPGTKLTRRYASMLALHMVQCGSVLQGFATKYLEKNKGNWINWKRRDDLTPEIPDNWDVSFLKLITHESCRFAITDEEFKRATEFIEISYLLRFFRQTELTVKIIDDTSVEGKYVDNYVNCPDCLKDRPLTLMSNRGICGYCEWGVNSHTEHIMCRCYTCGSMYARSTDAYVDGHSKCHSCRYNGTPPPCCTCKGCGFNFVQFYNRSDGLPNGLCGECNLGHASRILKCKEITDYAHRIFPDLFATLCNHLGYTLSVYDFNVGTALHDAVLYIHKSESIKMDTTIHTLYRNRPIQNVPDLLAYLLNVMSGSEVILPECSICMDPLPSSNLILACERKGCKQRICYPCSKSWYSKNTPGTMIYQRATLCQFCCRIPSPRILSKTDNRLIPLVYQINKVPLDPDVYYGWCKTCLQPHEIAHRTCITDAPTVNNYECSNCINEKTPTVPTKNCPGCDVSTNKYAGCNHMACPCGIHWCWECNVKCDTSDDTYAHMRSVHGRIFETEDPDLMEEYVY